MQLFVPLAAIAGVACAQSPLTTYYQRNNGGSPGGCILFDLIVHADIAITALDVNAQQVPGIAGSLDVFACPGTHMGNETNPAVWTLVASGSCTTAGINRPTRVTLAQPFALPQGSHGIQLRASSSFSHAYTNGTGSANSDFPVAEVTLRAGAAQNVQFGPPIHPRVFNGSVHFTPLPGFAGSATMGTGCYDSSRSFYELFDPSAAFDLANRGMRLQLSGSAYVVGAAGTFVPPSAGATVLPLTYDSEVTVPLAGSLPLPGGSATSLTVCSNGFVSAGPGNGVLVPDLHAWHRSVQPRWGSCHHYDTRSSGQITYERVGSSAHVTWNAVGEPGPQYNPGVSTWQLQFDLASGDVTFVWAGMSTTGIRHLVGFAAAGSSHDRGNLDLSALLANGFATSATDGPPLHLHSGVRPVLGTNTSLITDNMHAGAAFGANVLSFTGFLPGRELSATGMPGCFQYAGLDAVRLFLPVPGAISIPLFLPSNPALAGMQVFSQSLSHAPGANPLGIISSNGLSLILDVL